MRAHRSEPAHSHDIDNHAPATDGIAVNGTRHGLADCLKQLFGPLRNAMRRVWCGML